MVRRPASEEGRCTFVRLVEGAVLREGVDCTCVGREDEDGRVLVVRRPVLEDPPVRDVLRDEAALGALELVGDAAGRLTRVGPSLSAGMLKLNVARMEVIIRVY